MPRLDKHHETVKNALIKDGWKITDDPLILEIKDLTLYADLGAERTFAAERDDEKIAVEIKTFESISLTSELEKAKGQYDFYKLILKLTEPERDLFLAIPEKAWKTFFQRPSIQLFMDYYELKIIVYNTENEEVKKWIK